MLLRKGDTWPHSDGLRKRNHVTGTAVMEDEMGCSEEAKDHLSIYERGVILFYTQILFQNRDYNS